VTKLGDGPQQIGVLLLTAVSTSSLCSDPFWDPPSPFSADIVTSFSEDSSGRSVKLENHIHVVPKLRRDGIIPPIPAAFWRRGT